MFISREIQDKFKERNVALLSKNYDMSDSLRKFFKESGYDVMDFTKDNKEIELKFYATPGIGIIIDYKAKTAHYCYGNKRSIIRSSSFDESLQLE